MNKKKQRESLSFVCSFRFFFRNREFRDSYLCVFTKMHEDDVRELKNSASQNRNRKEKKNINCRPPRNLKRISRSNSFLRRLVPPKTHRLDATRVARNATVGFRADRRDVEQMTKGMLENSFVPFFFFFSFFQQKKLEQEKKEEE